MVSTCRVLEFEVCGGKGLAVGSCGMLGQDEPRLWSRSRRQSPARPLLLEMPRHT